ncbi:MAG: hypothetical protein ACXWLH_00625 [Candidatus Saccharimonadales bacterium]
MAKDELFNQSFEIYGEFIKTGETLDRDNTLSMLSGIERTGLASVGEGSLSMLDFSQTMHGLFTKVSELDLEPPLTQEQIETFAGKVATYAAAQESAAPKPARRAKRTSTKAAKTDDRKA